MFGATMPAIKEKPKPNFNIETKSKSLAEIE